MKGALAAGAMMSAASIPSKLFAGEFNIPDPLKPLPTDGGNSVSYTHLTLPTICSV